MCKQLFVVNDWMVSSVDDANRIGIVVSDDELVCMALVKAEEELFCLEEEEEFKGIW